MWASRIQDTLGDILVERGHEVMFRPGSEAISMVSLRPDRPQRGKSGIRNLAGLAQDFDTQYRKYCVDIGQGRSTPEKRLQSYLVSQAQCNGHQLTSLESVSGIKPVLFVCDEIKLPTGEGPRICDLFAVIGDDDGTWSPLIVELKSKRAMTELEEQLHAFSALVDAHTERFGNLASAVLNQTVTLCGPCRKWLVWPSDTRSPDRRADGLREKGILCVGYNEVDGRYEFVR
jgi:hypothetical protein